MTRKRRGKRAREKNRRSEKRDVCGQRGGRGFDERRERSSASSEEAPAQAAQAGILAQTRARTGPRGNSEQGAKPKTKNRGAVEFFSLRVLFHPRPDPTGPRDLLFSSLFVSL